MKKYLSGAIAVMLAILFSAFTVEGSKEKASNKQSSFYWFNGTTYTGFKTKAAEMTASGCQDNVTPVCRNGYDSGDLINPAQPEAGLKEGALPDETIRRTS